MLGPRETACLGPVWFDWDPRKHEQNCNKHRIRFEDVLDVFDDNHHISIGHWDDASGEWRDRMIAMASGRLVVVCYVMREDAGRQVCRLISVRSAEPKERRAYHDAD